MSRPQFKPALWPALAAATGIALTLALGNWQLERGNEKADLAERVKIASRDALIELPRIATPAQAVAGLASVPDHGIEMHYGFAFQWFAPAVEILVFYRVTHVKKRAREG